MMSNIQKLGDSISPMMLALSGGTQPPPPPSAVGNWPQSKQLLMNLAPQPPPSPLAYTNANNGILQYKKEFIREQQFDSSVENTDDAKRSAQRRGHITDQQHLYMEKCFLHDPFPDPASRLKIAEHLGLSPRAIKIWYQNRRTRAGISLTSTCSRSKARQKLIMEQIRTQVAILPNPPTDFKFIWPNGDEPSAIPVLTIGNTRIETPPDLLAEVTEATANLSNTKRARGVKRPALNQLPPRPGMLHPALTPPMTPLSLHPNAMHDQMISGAHQIPTQFQYLTHLTAISNSVSRSPQLQNPNQIQNPSQIAGSPVYQNSNNYQRPEADFKEPSPSTSDHNMQIPAQRRHRHTISGDQFAPHVDMQSSLCATHDDAPLSHPQSPTLFDNSTLFSGITEDHGLSSHSVSKYLDTPDCPAPSIPFRKRSCSMPSNIFTQADSLDVVPDTVSVHVDSNGAGDISLSSITEEDIMNMMRTTEGMWTETSHNIGSTTEALKAGFRSSTPQIRSRSRSTSSSLLDEVNSIMDFLKDPEPMDSRRQV